MNNILQKHKETWAKKKILRDIYTAWYKEIIHDLAQTKKKTIEMGAGSGNFKEFKPDAVSSDIDHCSWLDLTFDAHHMPFKDAGIGNIVMIDVLHHLADPVFFLKEAGRVLEEGGRIVLLEPFPSPFSLFIYKRFHPEPFVMDWDYFKNSAVGTGSASLKDQQKDPWESNQAAAYLLFYKHREQFLRVLGTGFKIIKRKRMSCILYPASGGFERPAFIPGFLVPVFKLIEMVFVPFRWLMAFRCYVVLEKKK